MSDFPYRMKVPAYRFGCHVWFQDGVVEKMVESQKFVDEFLDKQLSATQADLRSLIIRWLEKARLEGVPKPNYVVTIPVVARDA